MKTNHKPENKMPENTDPVQTAANEFVAQFSDEELLEISQYAPTQMKEFILQLSTEHFAFMAHVLPGRPDRPKKPQI